MFLAHLVGCGGCVAPKLCHSTSTIEMLCSGPSLVVLEVLKVSLELEFSAAMGSYVSYVGPWS
jgi:hypothetical protein